MRYLIMAVFAAACISSAPVRAESGCEPSAYWPEVHSTIMAMNGPYIAYYELSDPHRFADEGDAPDTVGYYYKPNGKNEVLVVYVKNGCVTQVRADIPASDVWLAERK